MSETILQNSPASSATVPLPASPPPAPKCSNGSIDLPDLLLQSAGLDWGRRMPATWFCLRCVLLRRFCPEPFRPLRHQLCHPFLGIPLHWASGLHPFRVPFTLLLRIAILLQGSISSPENPERGDVADRGDPITLRVPGILCAPAFPGASPSAW